MISDSSCAAAIIARETMFHTTKQHLYLNLLPKVTQLNKQNVVLLSHNTITDDISERKEKRFPKVTETMDIGHDSITFLGVSLFFSLVDWVLLKLS